MTGIFLGHCQTCSVPEIVNVFNRAGIDYQLADQWSSQRAGGLGRNKRLH